ncbi:MAG: methyltransferase domain-containing protein [Pseudomonadales bacterium]
MGRGKLPRSVDVQVDALGLDGLGHARHLTRELRVKNGLPGEQVSARAGRRRRGIWYVEAERIEDPAAMRVAPACGEFPRCGGCVMQHLDYAEQVRLKESQLLDALAQSGIEPEQRLPAATGPRFHYRSKARLGVRVVGTDVLVGFRESFSNRVMRMDACPALVPSLSSLIGPLRDLIAGLSQPDRVPQVEVAAGDGATALVLRHLTALTPEDRIRIESFGARHRVRCYTQSGGYDTVTPASRQAQQPYLSYGNPDFGLQFHFSVTDFTQVNLAMNRQLVRSAVDALRAPRGSAVLDLFCGIGNFSLPLASRGLRVKGLESSAEAIDRARLNAARNGLGGWCEFAVQDLYDADCPDPGGAEFVVLDPPRSGAGPNLAAWLASGDVRRIVYVSCSPASFAADAARLGECGYALEQVRIFDMFPHTAHVETLGVFQKRW